MESMKLNKPTQTSRPAAEPKKRLGVLVDLDSLKIPSKDDPLGGVFHKELQGANVHLYFDKPRKELPFGDWECGKLELVYRIYGYTMIKISSTSECGKTRQFRIEEVAEMRSFGYMSIDTKPQPRIR